MPANSPMIRLTVWVEAADYHDMHALSTQLKEKHAPFVRRAIHNEITRIKKRGECRRVVAVEPLRRDARLA